MDLWRKVVIPVQTGILMPHTVSYLLSFPIELPMTDSKIGVIPTEANAEWKDLWTMLKDLSTVVEITIYLTCHPNPLFFLKLTSGNDVPKLFFGKRFTKISR
ncbi:hypothetical protein QF042_005278 [Pedobacter sp. W3I1]|nr:hypothetical protein [Pedobacter sp. W3I1]